MCTQTKSSDFFVLVWFFYFSTEIFLQCDVEREILVSTDPNKPSPLVVGTNLRIEFRGL